MTNTECPDYSSHQQNAAEQLGFDIDATLSTEDQAKVDAIAEIEYRECEGH